MQQIDGAREQAEVWFVINSVDSSIEPTFPVASNFLARAHPYNNMPFAGADVSKVINFALEETVFE